MRRPEDLLCELSNASVCLYLDRNKSELTNKLFSAFDLSQVTEGFISNYSKKLIELGSHPRELFFLGFRNPEVMGLSGESLYTHFSLQELAAIGH